MFGPLPPRSLSHLRQLLRQGVVTTQEVRQQSLALCRRIQPALNPFTHLVDVDADDPAHPIAPGSPRLLEGVTLAVKDNFCTRGLPTTCASRMLKDFVPPYDASVVRKSLDAGACLMAKTNMDEFGMGSGGVDSTFGPTKSVWRSGKIPYQLRRRDGQLVENARTGQLSPKGCDSQTVDNGTNEDKDDDWIIAGGSSSGSAVAVSTGACLAALGSDTGGSVRIPAAWNGVVSLKPTYGALSRHGLIPLVNSLDVPGLLTRCVDDVASLFNVLRGLDVSDATTLDFPAPEVALPADPDLSRMTVGIPQEFRCPGMTSDVLDAWSDVADLLESSGVRVVPVSLPHVPYSIACYQLLNPCEVASNMARYDGLVYGLRGRDAVATSTEAMYADSRHRGFNDVVRGRILAGNYFLLKENYDKYFMQGLKVRRLISRDFDRVWRDDEVDVLLTPVTLSVAPTYRSFVQQDNRTQTSKQDYCTQPVNLAGLPAATVPVRLSEAEHLPISLQVIGQRCQEETVLSLCKWIENRLDFPQVVLEK